MSPDAASSTCAEALAWATAELRRSPGLSDSAARDAALLLRHTLSLTAAELRAWPERRLSAEQQQTFRTAIARRFRHEPIQYITGEQEFFGLRFEVSPAVLIPRPETELLVEAVLSELGGDKDRVVHVVDVGTGSGAIAIALAKGLPAAEITAVDISPAALAVAQGNASRLGVASRLRLIQSDLLDSIPGDPPAFEAIVSNPPYVAEGDRDSLHPEVREHEPAHALFAGASGLDVYRRLIPQAAERLRPGGLLAMELGYGQRDSVADLLAGWEDVRFLDDLRGIPRVVLAHRPPSRL